MSDTLTNYWNDVEEAVKDAHLIAWDGCHKIYLPLDEFEAEWFRDNGGYEIVTGTANELLAQLHEWYNASCGLKFITTVVRNEDDPNAGYTTLIPQGAEWEDEEEEDDYEEEGE